MNFHLKFNSRDDAMQFEGREFMKLNKCGADTFDQRKYFPDNVSGRNVFQAVKNGFFVDSGKFHQPLDRNDFHVAGDYFIYSQPGCHFLLKAAGNAETQLLILLHSVGGEPLRRGGLPSY